MQSVCFKIDRSLLDKVDDLVRSNIFFSRAEIFRSAIHYYLKYLGPNNNEEEQFKLDWENNWESDAIKKESISAKLPIGIVKVMDDASINYDSRSQFIREALKTFLSNFDLFFHVMNDGE